MSAEPALVALRPAVSRDKAYGFDGGRLRRLFATVPFASACPQLGYAVVGYFSALQIQAMDSAHKVEKLAFLHVALALSSLLAQPLIGVLSDRTRSRFGSRTPYMLVGALVGCVGLLGAGLSASIAALTVAAIVSHVGFNTYGGPLAAIQADRVPLDRRGRYSALAGLGTIGAGVLGPAIGSMFATRISLGYGIVAAVILVVSVAFLAVNPDRDNRDVVRARFSLKAIGKTFWVNPKHHPDFAWVFLGRFLLCAGYYMVLGYQLYIFEDYIGLSVQEATKLAPIMSLVSLPGFILALGFSGPLSDRMGRRKPVVIAGGLIIAASALIPAAFPTVSGMMCSIIVLTIGFGTFLAVDQALVTQVLPSTTDTAKDIGVINIAATLPNTFAPMMAAFIVTNFGYGTLYPIVALVAAAGALAVIPVKIP
ncbi:MFS transporter [Mycobacteroides abscessus]|uniref:MFS transporter n=1 Tax=Mycobacteroides abscessus TaxID=36809 RepID=UPI000929BAB4|nr:MFS transporter [Mycobacteroides abscessus]SHP55435.1 Major facilitator superfamily [Mycobacteroides abscessus subsp. bolletii]SHS28302.1 Major facilitator superfamily [Mycobacteroides abscessus subsp. bolletii]SHS77738.1 Major facilitator superfamily [Mycobacteroides abscessus subsp. bolletii]SKF64846.1 Major facilitator superfamily [Mycobacteroides abscessus subsp. bolletii]SKG36882.1 Major facilitator superfamily [Mycobacteroides abscessus subsp. bolletii]